MLVLNECIFYYKIETTQVVVGIIDKKLLRLSNM